jgi:Pyruvate/2-oxoacid:ferredoxin oxidoreductase delta subunit
VIDFSTCSLCGVCVSVCPHSVIYRKTRSACDKCIKYCITMDVPCEAAKYAFDYRRCDSCGTCIEACSENSISWFTPDQKPLLHAR